MTEVTPPIENTQFSDFFIFTVLRRPAFEGNRFFSLKREEAIDYTLRTVASVYLYVVVGVVTGKHSVVCITLIQVDDYVNVFFF